MQPMSRRQLLQTAGAGAAALLLAPWSRLRADDAKPGFTLPKLPYDYDALEPHIDAQTMKIHHDKHHQTYVDNLNKALAGNDDLLKKDISEILRDVQSLPPNIKQAVINNGGGHANHSLFWVIMAPKGGGQPSGALAKAIDDTFGGLDKLKEKLNEAGIKRFGSGWSWLVLGKGKLDVYSTANQDSPISKGDTPLLGIDVWEHAYYLKYQNKRADYLKAWWNVVNWDNIGECYDQASKQA